MNTEEKRGYIEAMGAIRRDGASVKMATHHRGMASGDLTPTSFTKGWKRACDDFISARTVRSVNQPQGSYSAVNGEAAAQVLRPDGSRLCYISGFSNAEAIASELNANLAEVSALRMGIDGTRQHFAAGVYSAVNGEAAAQVLRPDGSRLCYISGFSNAERIAAEANDLVREVRTLEKSAVSAKSESRTMLTEVSPIESIRSGDFSYAASLLAVGDAAQLSARDAAGRTAPDAARYYGASDRQVASIRRALTEGLTVLTRKGEGEPLADLAAHCDPKHKTRVFGVYHSLGTAAVCSGQRAVLESWLAAGGDPNARTPVGLTLLNQATLLNRPDMCGALIAARANPLGRDAHGLAAIEFCRTSIGNAFSAAKDFLEGLNKRLGAEHLKPGSGLGL